MPKTSEAQLRADKKRKEKIDRIVVYLPKGFAAVVRYHASIHEPEKGSAGHTGYSPKGSVSAFVHRAILAAMEADAQAAKEKERGVKRCQQIRK